MHATQPTDKKRSSHRIRPNYVRLGTDAAGGTHLYRTTDETIFAFDAAGRREHRFDIDAPARVDDYMAHVADARGWASKHYGLDTFADRIAEAV